MPVMDEFVTWLTEELDERGWTGSELARRAGVVPSTVSTVISGAKRPGLEFCVGVARALGILPEEVLRRAGLLPPAPPPVVEEARVLRALRELTATERDAALRMLHGLRGQPGHGVNEHPPAYTASPLRPEFDELAAQLAALPDGPIRNEAMAAIRAIAASAQQRAAASPHHEESHESETRDVAGPGPHLAPG